VPTPDRYFDDLQVGEVSTGAPILITDEDIMAFGRVYDPHRSGRGCVEPFRFSYRQRLACRNSRHQANGRDKAFRFYVCEEEQAGSRDG
jgi:hypothetical protein